MTTNRTGDQPQLFITDAFSRIMKARTLHPANHPTPDPIAEIIRSALRGLKFGSVEITVYDGRIVQIERREKQRLQLNLDDPGGSQPD